MQSLLRAYCRARNGDYSRRIMQLGSLTTFSGSEVNTTSSTVIRKVLSRSDIFKSGVVALSQTATCSFFRNNQLNRCMSTAAQPDEDFEGEDVPTAPAIDTPPRIKFKRLDKTAKQIMTILDKEAVEQVRSDRAVPDIQPGCIVELKVEVPENKRRVSTLKGIVIARRNAGLNTTFRLRRLVAGVGVESVFPLYSPNIKEMKILDRKKVRRAKLYYLRDRMNALKK
ncbi:large ribosomal subunit protein bL19c-like isoform X1 [Carex rostrata]